MNISLQKLMRKMEAELNGAINAPTESVVRERIHSLKTLCELVLDEQQGSPVSRDAHSQQRGGILQQGQIPVQMQPMPFQAQQATQVPARIEMDDKSNGESLFDF